VFTGYSLAEISVLSMIAMPITTVDISNGMYYVDPVDNGQESEEVNPTGHAGPRDNVSTNSDEKSALLADENGKRNSDERDPPKIQIASEEWQVAWDRFWDPLNPSATSRHVHQPSDATTSLNETLQTFQSAPIDTGTAGTPATSVDGASVQAPEEPDADDSDTFSITESLKEFFEGDRLSDTEHPVYKCTGCDEVSQMRSRSDAVLTSSRSGP
jgi:hypothetical protein